MIISSPIFMESYVSFHLLLSIFAASALGFASASSLCPSQPLLSVAVLQSQCPLFVAPSEPLEVDGESLDRILSSKQGYLHTSVLFYASWCPFSHIAKSNFDALSSMFPQIPHLMLEKSSAMPIIFSKYGIHGVPSILMVNQTSRIRYSGSKDLNDLVNFYKGITGFEPVPYFAPKQPSSFGSEKSAQSSSPREFLQREPYLLFSLLFLCLKLFLYFFPGILSRLVAFWISFGWHPNLGVFVETSQLLGRIFHVSNLKRIWSSKLRLCKVRNFHNGAKNARVWASSLTSVSLGETSSNRGVQLDS